MKVTSKNIEKYLGRKLYDIDMVNEKNDIGIVRGLAWTAVGGTTLQIEVNTMPGKGELKLTGQLGDVMKESAQIALTYIRSIAEDYGVKKAFLRSMIYIFMYRKALFQKMDHLPVLQWQQPCCQQ